MRTLGFWLLLPCGAMLAGFLLLWWLSTLRLRQPSPAKLRAFLAGRVAAMALILLGLFAVIGIFAFPAFPLVWLVLAVVLAGALHRYRVAERKSLLWLLATAVERKIPLEVAARAYAEERPGLTAIRAANLAEYLEAGLPMSLALQRSGYTLPPAVQLAADLGQQTGSLGPALQGVVKQMDALETTVHDAVERLFYLGFVLLYALAVLSFMMLKIVPVFAKMMDEFGCEMPALTRFVIDLSDWGARYGLLLAPLLLLLALPIIAALLRYMGIAPRWLPLGFNIGLRADSALVLRWLAVAARQQRPLAEFVRLLAGYFPAAGMRSRLARAAGRIEQGAPWQESLYRVGILRGSERRVFQAAERAGNLAWALDEMADASLRRSTYRFRAALEITLPVLLVAFGFLVLGFAVAMLLPLIKLIEALA